MKITYKWPVSFTVVWDDDDAVVKRLERIELKMDAILTKNAAEVAAIQNVTKAASTMTEKLKSSLEGDKIK